MSTVTVEQSRQAKKHDLCNPRKNLWKPHRSEENIRATGRRGRLIILFAGFLLTVPQPAGAEQESARLGISATVIYPAIVKTSDNGSVAVRGELTYTVETKYEGMGRKVIIVLYQGPR